MLSESDIELFSNPTIFVRKHNIIQQLTVLLERCKNSIYEQREKTIFAPFITSSCYQKGKISKGENYQFQPYLVLDYPASFYKQDVIAYRIFCWWGHYFSFSWLLQGKQLIEISELLQQKQHYVQLCQQDAFICTQSLWHHAVEPVTHKKISALSEKEWKQTLQNTNCIKITTTLPLTTWQKLPENSVKYFLGANTDNN